MASYIYVVEYFCKQCTFPNYERAQATVEQIRPVWNSIHIVFLFLPDDGDMDLGDCCEGCDSVGDDEGDHASDGGGIPHDTKGDADNIELLNSCMVQRKLLQLCDMHASST